MESMATRFETVATQSSLLHKQLVFEESHYRLLSFLAVAEAKLRLWTAKFGFQDDVVALLADYQVDLLEWPSVLFFSVTLCLELFFVLLLV